MVRSFYSDERVNMRLDVTCWTVPRDTQRLNPGNYLKVQGALRYVTFVALSARDVLAARGGAD
ncbi:MAG: hypothetical protein CSA72_03665 [Rhodobacterales bacterium]|nr:MAG: hypothetical protein CSA72_03665 [Rhodobacterales bacterium]